MIKTELEIVNIKHHIKLLKSESISFADFKRNCENSIGALEQELGSTLGLLGGIKGAGKITEIIDHGIKTLEKAYNKNTGLKNIVNHREFNEGNFSETLEDINRETKGMVSRICLEFDQTIMQHESKTFGIKCYEKFIREISYFYHDNNLNLINMSNGHGCSIKESEDPRLAINKNVIKYPGTVKFIESLGNAEKRALVLPLLSCYNPADPESINPISRELLDSFKCGPLYITQLPAAEIIESDFSTIFKNGGWLEIYTYIKLIQAGCYHSMLNGIIGREDISVEGDVIGHSKGELFVFDCKNKVEIFDAEELGEIEDYLDRLKGIGTNKICYIICAREENVETLEAQLNTIAEEKSMEVLTLFLNTSGEDNLDAKLRGILNGR